MKIAGEYTMKYSREETWDALNDPQVIQKCTPGCQSMNTLAPDDYEMVVKIGIASISGTYKGKLKICDKVVPQKYAMVVEGSGPIGTMNVTGDVVLKEDGKNTIIAYNYDARIGGAIAGLARRGLIPIAKFLIKQFFESVAEEIAQRSGETRASTP